MEIKKERDRILRKIWKQTADFFFPMGTYCICCGKYIDHTRTYALCDHCIRHIRWGQIEINLDAEGKHWKRPVYLDSASACAFYGLYSRRLIFELKYNGHTTWRAASQKSSATGSLATGSPKAAARRLGCAGSNPQVKTEAAWIQSN